MALTSYKTLIKKNEDSFIINKSRFIGHGCPCETEEKALAFLASVRADHKDATHNCYAYIIGANMGVMRYSDDGEPGGTAGMPIIEVMKARGVTNCCVVVTRYFGGVLLGAGGLVRAYANSAKLALDAAGISVMRPWVRCRVECPYPLFERVRMEIEGRGGTVEGSDFTDRVAVTALLPLEQEETFREKIVEISAGSVSPERLGECMRPVPVER